MTKPSETRTAEVVLLLVLAFVAGFSMMLVEVTATRLLAPHFGTSTYTWTNVIGAILAALAGGYYIGGRLADRGAGLNTALALVAASGLLTAVVPGAALALGRSLAPAADAIVSGGPLLVRGSLLVTLLVFVPPVVVMAVLSPLVVRLLSRSRPVGWASGANSAVATFGALLGTFAPTLWLVPAWGSRRTVFLAAGVQLMTAATGFVLARRWIPAGGTALFVVAVALASALVSGPLAPAAGLVEERETEYQYASVVKHGPTTRLLLDGQSTGSQSVYTDGRFLTGGSLYDHVLLLPFLAQAEENRPLRVLVIGLAAGTMPRQYLHFHAPLRPVAITGVEIDPVLVSLAERHFDLGYSVQRGLEVRTGDGRPFLAGAKGPYDVIFVDVFANQFFIPFHLATREFFALVRERLAPGGVVGMNVIAHSLPSRLLTSLEDTLVDAFGSAARLRVPQSFNVMLMARRDAPLDPLAAARRIVDYPGPGREITEADALRSTLLRGCEEVALIGPRAGAAPLTDDRAPTEQLVLDDMRRTWIVR